MAIARLRARIGRTCHHFRGVSPQLPVSFFTFGTEARRALPYLQHPTSKFPAQFLYPHVTTSNIHRCVKINLYIMTCDGREKTLADTLASLKKTDWPDPPTVVHDTTRHPDPRISQTETARKILGIAEKSDAEYILFAEDDVFFSHHLAHNLANWLPLQNHAMTIGTLYSARSDPADGPGYCHLPPWEIGGSQCVVIKKKHISVILSRWHQWPWEWMHDLRIYRSGPEVIWSHWPSLVQHMPAVSTWGGPCHTSPTFNEDWRA